MFTLADFESGWLVAIRREAPFTQDLTKLCIHGIIALLGGFPPHFVRDYFTLWPLYPCTHNPPPPPFLATVSAVTNKVVQPYSAPGVLCVPRPL